MQFLLKLLITNMVIISCVMVGKKFPHLGGLIATMPLTSLVVLVWLHTDKPGDARLLTHFTEGVLWGIIPTILFFAVAYLCFTRRLPFGLTLTAAFGAWFLGAAVHQWLLRWSG
jgi:uncharacterized membrane protein (GlpM family)